MPGTQVERLVKNLLRTLPRVNDLDEAVEDVRLGLEELHPGLSENLATELQEAKEIVATQIEDVEILHRHSVIRRRQQWYFGPNPSDTHWPAFRDYLVNTVEWDEDDVDSIDDSSNEVVSQLENPAQDQFSGRGLVVGYVQSGKTANMTAVISKAIDAGYDTIIILAGLTNKLRYQTQIRLYGDLIQRNPTQWQVLTPNDRDGDFRAPPHGGFLSLSDLSRIAVVKKNVSPLGQLRDAIQRTIPSVLRQLKVLVIDDECDQASVNSSNNEMNMTAINHRIRELLSLLPAVTYVGYTATPFANVLINPYKPDGIELDDLYPRDFITALPRPAPYFGTEQLFGGVPDDAENLEVANEGLDVIREVSPEEEAMLQPARRNEKDTFQPKMTESLQEAILYFLATCAVRRARGHTNKHMTMLVHTSAYVAIHNRLASLIQGWIEIRRGEISDRSSETGQVLEQIWNSEQGRVPNDITEARDVSIEEIFSLLPDVLNELEFPVENGSSNDRIDYEGNPKTYIVSGGTILARGLTLEGLAVSYFLRSASQYDTLLQMGRWFGFRPGYEDLPRIWMTEDLRLRFRALASVEQEIRDDIEQYCVQELTPMDIAVRVRAIPGMAITAANKMRSARTCAISYWGTHKQTIRFPHRDIDVQQNNWQQAADLVSRAESLGLRNSSPESSNVKLWQGVPKSSIERFIEGYIVDSGHSELSTDILLAFIQGTDSRLDTWNLGIVESSSGSQSENNLGSIGKVKLVKRAKLSGTGATADIKALMSKSDIFFDLNESAPAGLNWKDLKASRQAKIGQIPLLLLYPIDKISEASSGSRLRQSLDAVHDVIGYGVIFPGSVTESGDYVSVELETLSADEIENIDAEEAAQAEAAGVE